MSIGKLLSSCLLLLGLAEAFACKPQINWASTLSFCAGNTFLLSAFNPNSTYLWNTGDTTAAISISTSGVYSVTVTNICGSTSDTIMVFVDQPVTPNLGKDRIMCSANNPVLSVPLSPNTTYLWQNNSTSHQIPVTQSGTYYVKVTNACGTERDTVNITLEDPPNVSLGPDINNCTGTIDTIGFPAVQSGKITWNTGDTVNRIVVTTPGVYWVKVNNSCGVFSDTIKVSHNQGSALDIGGTISKCATGTTILSSNISGGSFLWSNNSTSPFITVANPGMYWLRYTDNCNVYYDTAYVVNTGRALVDLGSDTNICSGTTLMLDAGNPGSIYTWSTGVGGRTIGVSFAGTYWVGVNNGCGVVYDTIKVSLTPTPIDSIGDTAYYCGSGYVDANAGRWGPTSYYYWDDGTTGRTHRYSSEGNHWVLVGNRCDTIRVDFYVKKLHMPPLDLGNDTVVCGPLLLDTKLPSRIHSFLWSGNTRTSYKYIFQSGVHWVKVTNACGTFTDSINVVVVSPPALVTPHEVTICQGGAATLRAEPADTLTTFRWSTGATTNAITVNSPGVYHLTASNLCDTLLDSVKVRLVQPLSVNLGPDTTLCSPQSIYLDVTSYHADSVRWSTGSRNGGLPVTQSGTYWVDLYNACGVFSDTIKVKILKKPKKVFGEKAFCIGGSVSLNATQTDVTGYQWSTGAITPVINVNQQGWYWVDRTNQCGTVRDSVWVRQDLPIQPFDLGNDTIFCSGSLWLEPTLIQGVSYSWQDGTTARRHLVTRSGTYWVTASNTCNSRSDTINILITGPPKLTLGDTVRFCHGSIFTLNAQNPGCTYLWNDSSTSQYFSASTPGKYWVTITNPCGVLTDTVELLMEYPLLNLELGNDTVICRGQSVTLDAGYSGVTTSWNTGASSRQIVVTETGNYHVMISNSCGAWSDSIFVEVQEVPVFNLGRDSVICNIEGSVYLEGPPDMEVYQWSNGDTSQATTFLAPGEHWLRVANRCFEYSDTLKLVGEDPIEMDLGPDTTLCFGESLLLSPGDIDYPVHWYNGLVGSSREITRGGEYWASATNSCGTFFDTILVRMDYPLDPGISDTTVCMGDSAIVDLRNKRLNVRWFDGSDSRYRSFKEPGVYGAAITNTCGTFYKEFEVDLNNCNCPLYMANAFSPNGDGLNDEYRAVFDCEISTFELVIFNRWGERIFKSDNPNVGWDGNVHGSPAPIGTYNYTLRYGWMVYDVDRVEVKQGVINVIR